MQQTTTTAAMAALDSAGLGAGRRARILRRVLVAGAVAGALDIIYAFTVWWLKDVPPTIILQSIASGLFGRAAFAGGMPMVVLGAFLHFMMTIIMAAVFAGAAGQVSTLARRPIIWGAAYGVGIWLTMRYIVVPLSLAAGGGGGSLLQMLGNLGAHILLVGIPIALITTRGRRFWRR